MRLPWRGPGRRRLKRAETAGGGRLVRACCRNAAGAKASGARQDLDSKADRGVGWRVS